MDKNIDVGLYRDDGLISSRLTNRQTERIKNQITNIFANYGLKLEINANQKVVNFLDVTLDLNKELYTPYMKVNNTIRYVNKKSNHPPSVLKNIPENINNRITRNSSNAQVFNSSIQPYKDALSESGHSDNLKFDPNVKQNQHQQKNRKHRGRKITWSNPPFSLTVKSNIGQIFLRLIKECFPRTHILSKKIAIKIH